MIFLNGMCNLMHGVCLPCMSKRRCRQPWAATSSLWCLEPPPCPHRCRLLTLLPGLAGAACALAAAPLRMNCPFPLLIMWCPYISHLRPCTVPQAEEFLRTTLCCYAGQGYG